LKPPLKVLAKAGTIATEAIAVTAAIATAIATNAVVFVFMFAVFY
jgi:hypothetical protein